MFRFAEFRTGNREVAYDVLQDVYLKVWQIRRKLDPERSLNALLYQMVSNRCVNQLRRGAYKYEVRVGVNQQLTSREALQDHKLHVKDQHRMVVKWIHELPPRRQEALVLSRFEGLSHVEVATVMGLTPKTVNNHITLALAHLRKQLKDYSEYEEEAVS